MRLKPAGIIIVLLIIGVLAYFALKPKLSQVREENSTELSNTSQRPADESADKSSKTNDTKTESREFQYTPEAIFLSAALYD